MREELGRPLQPLVERVRAVMRKLGADSPAVAPCDADPVVALSSMINELEPGIDRLIEQRQQREREVMRADQLAMVGQVAAGFAHEIRNPLTAVKLLVQTARKEGGTSLGTEDLEVIEHEIRRMERSLQRFLDFARPPRPERRPLDLRLVVGRVLTLLQTRATRQSVTFVYRRPEFPIIVEADEDQIQQLILNLVMNALDAMSSGGNLECQMEQQDIGFVELRVSDTGPGIPVDLLPRLFDPFISTKETGIGLGLAVSFRIAENHGGRLSAENLSAGGARFIVRLPGVDGSVPLASAPRTTDAE
jgi:two-component system, NtrC family, sensor histidine kinase HydH